MKQLLYIITIFLFVMFIYIHVLYHLKTNNLLEFKKINITGKEDFEEKCNNRLPFICNFNNNIFNNLFNQNNLLQNYKSFELVENKKRKKPRDLFDEDSFVSKDNLYFLNETDSLNTLQKNDHFLRPSFTFIKNYNLIIGKNKETHFMSFLNFRNFFYVCEGSLDIYLANPKSSKYLNFIYNNLSFSNETNFNPFDEKFQNSEAFDKIKPFKLTINKGEMLFLPSSWYISMCFKDTASILSFQYRTCMNLLTLTPNYLNKYYEYYIINSKN